MQINDHKKFSENKIQRIQDDISKIKELKDSSLCVYTTGSYGRLEASENSDIDLFFLDTDQKNPTSNINQILINAKIIYICRDLKFKEFSKDGLYLKIYHLSDIKQELGGQKDDYNNFFTVRMLLLLEAKPLGNNELFEHSTEQIIESYYVDFHRHKNDFVPLFLTNDIIRFWKTMCLNYEHRKRRKSGTDKEKIVAHSKNLKLKFSRKLTCFSFILKLVEFSSGTISQEDVKKISLMTPLERLESLDISGEDAQTVQNAIASYQWFIDHTQIPSEKMLLWLENEKSRDDAFNKSREFGNQLYQILKMLDTNNIIAKLLI